MPVPFDRIEPLLMRVEKPARYVGGEYNRVVKPDARVRVCLAFPDVYDLGMSYHGYNLLYDRVNRRENWAAERAYTPWPDFATLLRERGLPLYSLETFRALSEFDVVGFTLQHEVNYTNILEMLDLGGVPILAADRRDPFPFVVGGGEGAYSPEPMAPFFDAFVVGDGEEAIDDVCELVERAKDESWDRERLLFEASRVPGVYVPSLYAVEYLDDGRVARAVPVREGVPAVVKKRHYNVTLDDGAVRPVVPLLRTVHDRFAIEIRRGCVNGCRFCQAGMITRPVRERSVDAICEIAAQGIANTGYDEVSLLSLSSADYTAIGALVRRMTREFGPKRVSISLPSLRINAFDVDVADEIRGVRKSGFTFAPEAGTDRLRKVINKEVDQDDFLRIVGEVFERGWKTVKFYFMVGLPTETEEDLDGIVEITRKAADLGRKIHGRKAIVNVTLSPFVPKSNTPFQWEPQPEEAELRRRYDYVRARLRGPNIDVKTNDTGSSFIEACLARGDRRMAAVVRRAWELGCRFDGWDEYFDKERWLRAFEEVGLDPTFYANRRREEDEVFPFDHIDSSLGKRFLWADQRRAWRMRVMERCEVGKCAGCVACDDVVDHILARDQPGAIDGQERFASEVVESRAEKEQRLSEGRELKDPDEASMLLTAESEYSRRARELAAKLAEKAAACGGDASGPDAEAESCAPEEREEEANSEPTDDGVFSHYRKRRDVPKHRFAEPERVQRIRFEYEKRDAVRYLSHLDLIKTLNLTLRRAGAPLAYSEGFNPQPRTAFAPPLPLGYGGLREKMDVLLVGRVDPEELRARMNERAPDSLRFVAAEEIDMKAESIDASATASVFRATIDLARLGVSRSEFEDAVARFDAAESFPVEVRKKKGIRAVDLKESIGRFEILPDENGRANVRLAVTHADGSFVQPHVALGFVLGRPLDVGEGLAVDREEILSEKLAVGP